MGVARCVLLSMEAPPDAGLRGLPLRAADALTGAVYVGLAAAAVGVLAFPAGSTGLDTEAWVARVLRLPLGEALLGGGGIMLLGSGAYLAYKSVAHPFGSRQAHHGLAPLRRSRGARLSALAVRG